jgi:aminopeptidase N
MQPTKWTFTGIHSSVIPSLLRDFSAPVILNYQTTDQELLFLMQHDNNGFNRWLSAQTLFERMLLAMINNANNMLEVIDLQGLLTALQGFLPQLAKQDPALAAKLLSLPSENYLAEKTPVINPSVIHQARVTLQASHCSRIKWLFCRAIRPQSKR